MSTDRSTGPTSGSNGRSSTDLGEPTVRVHVNGMTRELGATSTTSLLRALRSAGLTGTTGACEQGECGSCSVVLDGALVCSCLVAAFTCDGRSVTTIEHGVAADLGDALERHGAVQCGFCTPGMVMAATTLLDRCDGALTRGAVTEGLAGNLCRCTGYRGIIEAVLEVDGLRRNGA
ncbi:MAG: xanthine dehydrogenase iron-sulfur-binding subunit [Ilumatobacteraceae bacterium]|nr:xanthine dehydrogenase iron-sulfur-binding subunit [Ilumatobacteraceae bacterium]